MEVQISVRVPEEVAERIEAVIDGATRTEKFRNYLCSEIVFSNVLRATIRKCRADIEIMEKLSENDFFSSLSEPLESEKKFLAESKKIVGEKGDQFLIGQCDSFNNMFRKNYTAKEYRYLLSKLV